MDPFERWVTLLKLLNRGHLAFIDLAFAESVLKKLGSDDEAHAALLAILFALSRKGHLTLDISAPAMPEFEAAYDLLHQGIATFPEKGIANSPEGRPTAWICKSGNYFYLQKNWVCESEILAHLDRLCKSSPLLQLSGNTLDPALNEAQKMAVEKGLQHSLSLLTGGPGTGKTFTAAELVKACLLSLSSDEREHFRIIVAAPTGKAVAQLEGNLRKAVGAEAHFRCGTLHSILGIKPAFHEEEIQPLFADLVIVDECSMIDARIFSRLLASVQTGTRLILIGDKDQLPPVDAGSIFADLLESGIFPVTHLTKCLRSDRMEILSLAKSIRDGAEDEVLALLSSADWTDLEEGKKTASQLYNQLWDRCKGRFPSFFQEKPKPDQILKLLGEFNILSCMRQGSLGVDALNAYFLSQYLRQAVAGSWWAAPILITRNDHELQLFNGDLGLVVRQVSGDFSLGQFHIDDYALFFDRKEGFRQIPALALGSFEYSYCQSVHKSQGSEYDEVLILVPSGSESFGREVLYTAVTRAKNKVSLAGAETTLRGLIATSSRKTSGLKHRLQKN